VSFLPGLYASNLAAAPLSGVDVLPLSDDLRIDFFGVAFRLTDFERDDVESDREVAAEEGRSYGLMTI
jgi:hypothetical protein